MKTLLWMGLREVMRTKGRVILVAIILALQVSTLGGSYIALESLIHTRDSYYAELNFADLEVGFVGAASTEMPSLETLRQIPGVKSVTRRYLAKGYIEDEGDAPPYPVAIVHMDPGAVPDVNQVKVLSGRYMTAGQSQECVVDRTFADYRGIKVGDKLVVNPHSFPAKFTVVGIGLSSEFLAPTSNPDVFLPGKGTLGVIYASREQLDALFLDHLYNNLVFTYQAGQDPDAVRERVLAALTSLDIERVVPRKANFGYRLVEESLRGAQLLTPILAMVIAIVAGIVAYVTVNRIVMNQRREIGALLAMGYPPGHFVIGYLLLGLVPGIAGALLGMVWSIGLGDSMGGNISRITGLPPARMIYSPTILLLAGASAIVVAVACTLLPLMSILRMHPASAIRGGNEISFLGLPSFVEAIIGRGSAPTRYALRNIFRRKRLSLATVLLVCAGISVPVSLLTMNSSWINWAEVNTKKIPWDATLTFKVGLKPDALHEIIVTPGLKQTEGFVVGRATLLRKSGSPVEVRLRGIPQPLKLEKLELASGRMFSAPDAMEIIVDENVSRGDAKPRLGDKLTLVSKGKSYEVTIVGLANDAAMTTVYMPLASAQKILELEGKVTGLYALHGPNPRMNEPPPPLPGMQRELHPITEQMDVEDDKPDAGAPAAPFKEPDLEATKKLLLRNEIVVTVQSKKDTGKATIDVMREYKDSTMQFTFISSMMAFLALLSVLALLFLERESEYATLRAMGYGTREIARIVLTEVGVLVAVGLLMSLGGWYLLAGFFVKLMSETWFPLQAAYLTNDLLSVAVPMGFLLLLAIAFGVRSLMRLDLRNVLCARAIG